MRALTVRNLPSELDRLIRHKARELGLSLNKAIIRLLEESAGLRKKRAKARHADLDALAGAWSREDAAAFDAALAAQRRIEPGLWR